MPARRGIRAGRVLGVRSVPRDSLRAEGGTERGPAAPGDWGAQRHPSRRRQPPRAGSLRAGGAGRWGGGGRRGTGVGAAAGEGGRGGGPRAHAGTGHAARAGATCAFRGCRVVGGTPPVADAPLLSQGGNHQAQKFLEALLAPPTPRDGEVGPGGSHARWGVCREDRGRTERRVQTHRGRRWAHWAPMGKPEPDAGICAPAVSLTRELGADSSPWGSGVSATGPDGGWPPQPPGP